MAGDNKYDITDLITHALDQKPVEFETTFNSLLKDKLADAVATKKEQVAKAMFNRVDAEEPEEE